MYSVKRHIIIPVLFIVLLHGTTSGQPGLDSLHALVATAKSDSDRLDKRILYAIALSKIDLQKALAEIQLVKKEAQEKKLPELQVSAVLNMGNMYYDYADYVNCI